MPLNVAFKHDCIPEPMLVSRQFFFWGKAAVKLRIRLFRKFHLQNAAAQELAKNPVKVVERNDIPEL